LAWRTAGWWGLDRWLLPLLGTPWAPGQIAQRKATSSTTDTVPTQPA
jgi:thiosulfate dehydrogenase [quinone] large subunit